MKLFLVTLFVSLLAQSSLANENVPIEHSMDSGILMREQNISVQLPRSYNLQSSRGYPVLYLLDGESNLDYTSAVADFLAENGLIPEIIIVAIQAGLTRVDDYLPSFPDQKEGLSGHADRFLIFVEQELIPFVDKHYRAAPVRLLSGHSFGGVFVIYTLLERPSLFREYIAQSPYLDQTISEGLVTHATKLFAENPPLPAFFFMNLCDEPNLKPGFERLKMTLEKTAPSTLKWSAKRAAGKSHMTTRLVGQYDGLEQAFGTDWPMTPQEMFNAKSDGIRSHIASLSSKFGYPVLLNESLFGQAIQIFLSQQNVDDATQIAELYASYYPSSPRRIIY